MKLFCKFRMALLAVLSLTSIQAQITDNRAMSPVVDLTRMGWNVTPQNGNLTLAIPMTTVPGEVPVPVTFGMNATYTVTNFPGPMTTYKGPGPIPPPLGTTYELVRPAVGGVHFGYITTTTTYGNTATFRSTATAAAVTVLESGQQIYDSQWTAFSAHTELGTTLNLPQAYGFTSVLTTAAMVDPTATYLTYSTSIAGLGATYQNIVQALNLTGFGAVGTSYKVVLDKDRARVFAFATSLNTWVPVLWADRFGHYVTFQWVRSTSGLPTGVTAITSVIVTNQRSKGVNLRWAEYASNASEQDILSIDYIGLSAPSVIVRGIPEAGGQPSGFTDPYAVQNYDVPGRIYPYPSQFRVVPTIGLVCRPTSIQVGSPSVIPLPSWNGASGAAASIANRGASYSAEGATASALQAWSFTYDAAKAELSSFTDPKGLTTTFTYSNYSATRGVSRVDCVDSFANKSSMCWTRTFSSGTTPLTVKVEGWWNPDKMTVPDRYHLLTFPTDVLNYGNGVYLRDELLDSAGVSWKRTDYSLSSSGSGLNAGLSNVESVTVAPAGAPAITTTYGTPTSSKLQVTLMQVTTASYGANPVYISSTAYRYGTRWDMLEGHQLIQVDTTRIGPDGSSLGTVTQKNEYDTSSPNLLQLQRSYLDGGTAGKHGTSYAYDAQGRLNFQKAFHMEGSQVLDSNNNLAIGYDSASGAPSSQTTTNTAVTPNQYLTTTQGGFDSLGRATTQTDTAGVTTTCSFDDRGRILTKQRSGSPSVSYAYPNEWTVQTTENGLMTTRSYDGFGRLIQTKQPSSLTTSGAVSYTTQDFTYDAYGQCIGLRETNGAGTTRNQTWAYDPLNRVTSHTPFAGNTTTWAYYWLGLNQKTTSKLSNGATTSMLTDPFGQQVEVDSPDGSVTKAAYDKFGNVTAKSIDDGNGHTQTRSWTYDALGRLTSKVEPETNLQTYGGFNALNQPSVITEWANTTAVATADTRVRNLVYDGFGRIQSVSNGTDSLVYSYAGPNLTYATRAVAGTTVSQSFVYNGPGGLLSSETTAQPGFSSTIGYAYDGLGRLQTLTYQGGRVIGYAYDALSRVTGITNNGAALVSNIKFDDWGNRWQTQFASGAQDQWDADLTGTRLRAWNIGYVGGGPDGRGYTYDDATNILKSAGEWILTHDLMGRLTEADGFGIKTAHTYDAFSNSISHTATANGSAVPSTFNNFVFNPLVNNQIPGLESNGAPTGWNTNLRGEATQVGTATSSGNALGLGWDGLGALMSVVGNGVNQSFLYSPSGTRVSLTDTVSNGNNRKYSYTGTGLLLGEYLNVSGSPSWKRDVVYLGSQAIAEIDANGVHELHSDHLGSPRLMTKGAGTWASNLIGTTEGSQAYGAYGELIAQIGSYVPLTGYTGHVQTDASGLIYMRGRYYSPAWHAFVNSDQGVDPSAWNQRAYVDGSPFMGTDPSGKSVMRIGNRCFSVTYRDASIYDSGWDPHNPLAQVTQVVEVECPPDATGNGLDNNQYGSGRNSSSGSSFGRHSPQSPQPAPKVTCPLAASGVYRQNRWIHGNTPLSNGNPLSHTFVFTTNALGQVANTYSWGNNGPTGVWVQNAPEDINAANLALGGNYVLNRVGGSDMLNNIQMSFDVLRSISSEVHANGGITSNCKTEADQLISMSK